MSTGVRIAVPAAIAVATRPPPAAGPVRPAGRSGRRALVLIAVAVALVGLLAGGLSAATASVSLPPVAPTFGGNAVVTTVPEYGLRGTHIVGYDHGARLTLQLPLRNTGPLPITVTEVATGAGVLPLLTITASTGLPLQLGPGQQGRVVLEGTLGNCAYYSEREVQLVDGLHVTVDVLGRTTNRVVPLDRPLLIPSPMIVGCPDRKLDRQANIRSNAL